MRPRSSVAMFAMTLPSGRAPRSAQADPDGWVFLPAVQQVGGSGRPTRRAVEIVARCIEVWSSVAVPNHRVGVC